MGGGYLISNLRDDAQRNIGFDFHFHIRRQYFQAGAFMSGTNFGSNNNLQFHGGYGLRRERNKNNLAIFGGVSYYTGVYAVPDTSQGPDGTAPFYYQGAGAYFSAQAVTKLTYDIGIGVEFFGELSKKQNVLGFKFILFFSGAYRGRKNNFNPHVHSENKK